MNNPQPQQSWRERFDEQLGENAGTIAFRTWEKLDECKTFISQEIEQAKREESGRILNYLKEVEATKWEDAKHCTCLGYAIWHLEHPEEDEALTGEGEHMKPVPVRRKGCKKRMEQKLAQAEADKRKVVELTRKISDSRGTPLDPMGAHGLPECVIFDLDGTLACIGDRSPYDGKSCLKDLPNWSVITINKWVPNDVDIILFSGRSSDARSETLEWLDRYGVNFSALHMRDSGDHRKDSIVKEEMFNRYIHKKYRVLFAVDDRNQVVEMWRSLGITTLQVAPGDF